MRSEAHPYIAAVTARPMRPAITNCAAGFAKMSCIGKPFMSAEGAV